MGSQSSSKPQLLTQGSWAKPSLMHGTTDPRALSLVLVFWCSPLPSMRSHGGYMTRALMMTLIPLLPVTSQNPITRGSTVRGTTARRGVLGFVRAPAAVMSQHILRNAQAAHAHGQDQQVILSRGSCLLVFWGFSSYSTVWICTPFRGTWGVSVFHRVSAKSVNYKNQLATCCICMPQAEKFCQPTTLPVLTTTSKSP